MIGLIYQWIVSLHNMYSYSQIVSHSSLLFLTISSEIYDHIDLFHFYLELNNLEILLKNVDQMGFKPFLKKSIECNLS